MKKVEPVPWKEQPLLPKQKVPNHDESRSEKYSHSIRRHIYLTTMSVPLVQQTNHFIIYETHFISDRPITTY